VVERKDEEEWIMVDFVDLGRVKEKMEEQKSPEPLRRHGSAPSLRRRKARKPKEAEDEESCRQRKATSYFVLSKDLRIKREALCDDTNNAHFCDTTFLVGPDQRVYYGVSILFRIQTPSIAELWTRPNVHDHDDNEYESDYMDSDVHRGYNSEYHHPTVIVLEDIMPLCFEFLRAYFYCLNPPLCGDNAADVLYAAKKFGLPALASAARDFCLNVQGFHDSLAVLPRVHELGYYDLSQRILDDNELFEDARKMFQFKNLANIDHRLLDGVLTTAAMQKVGAVPRETLKGRIGDGQIV